MINAIISTIISILGMVPVFGLAAFGHLLSQKSGDYNLGVEGIMSSGAVFAIFGVYLGLNSWSAIGLGTFVGALFGLLLSLLIDKLKLNQIVVGFGVWFLSLGLAGSLYTSLLAGRNIKIVPIEPIFLNLDPIFYITIIIFLIIIIFFSYTKQGLSVLASGENPRAADSAGINVNLVRTICNIIGSSLMALAGAYVGINILQGFMYMMIAGYGWIAFALVIFGRWNVNYVFFGALLFTSITSISSRLAILGVKILPANFIFVLPHIAVLIGLTIAMIWRKESGMPSGLGQPYRK